MLLELAVGDAYGAGFEYAQTNILKYNDLSKYVSHPTHEIPFGYYTDDTQMSLAIAETIISEVEWTPLNLANKFVEVFKRDQRKGYAGGFYGLLMSVNNGEELLAKLRPDSSKSGAAMRAGPIGVINLHFDVLNLAAIQAAITHNTPSGIAAAQAAALMSHYCLYNKGPKEDLGEYLEEYVPGEERWSEEWTYRVGSQGRMSVRAAVTAVMRNDKLSTLLKDCIDFTGDVDTVATIALAAASESDDYEKDLPQNLIDTLENNAFGKDYLIAIDKLLIQREDEDEEDNT